MWFALRVFVSLALSLSVTSPVLAPSQSLSAFLISNQSPPESAVREVVEKYFALSARKDLNGVVSLWSDKSPDYASLKQNLERQFTTEDYGSNVPTISQIKVGELERGK